MLAIIIALESEIYDANDIKEKNTLILSNDQKFYISHKDNIVFAFSGVGKVNASNCISNLLKTFHNINNVINVGLAGSKDKTFQLGAIVIVEEYYYLDVDATIFGYKYGQVPRECEKYFSSKENNLILKELLVKIFPHFFSANIATSDSFVNKDNFSKFPKEIIDVVSLFDMEATAIASICYKNNVAMSSIKIVSDNIWNETNSKIEFKNSLINYEKLIQNIKNIISDNSKLFQKNKNL